MTDARTITDALGGRWSGSNGMARCPCHEDRTPSLSVTNDQDGTLLVHCFANCDPVGVDGSCSTRRLDAP